MLYTLGNCLKLTSLYGGNPVKGYNPGDVFLFTLNIVGGLSIIYMVVLQFIYTEAEITMIQMTDAVTCILLFCHGITKSSTIFSKKRLITKLLLRMEKYFWNPDSIEKTEYQNQLRSLHLRIFYTYRFILAMHITNALGFLAGALFTEEEILPFECYRPKWLHYYILQAVQNLISLHTILFPVVSMDLMFMSILRVTMIQFRLLCYEIEELFDCCSTTPQSRFREKLAECIAHHNMLLEYVDTINETFSLSILVFIDIIMFSMCVEMYIISSISDWKILRKAIIYAATGCIQFMLCYCYPAQELTDEINAISTRAYFSEWYHQYKYGRYIYMIITRGNKTVPIKAGGFFYLNLQTGISTLKSMVSYAMFLKTISSSGNS